MTRWYSGLSDDDVRYRLRHALHSRELREHYDVVLIDCPPRLTTGCVNALAASDYVLIPVLLEKTSTEAVPRTLSWLKRFQAQVCTELDVLGVVGNKANPRIKLINRERILWTGLEPKCRDAWGDGVRLFDEIIRDHSDAKRPLGSSGTKTNVATTPLLIRSVRRSRVLVSNLQQFLLLLLPRSGWRDISARALIRA